MKRYVLTPSAKKDVNDIWDYIAGDNIKAAGRVPDVVLVEYALDGIVTLVHNKSGEAGSRSQ
jgi:plasmid stabilization system protein ParE